MEKKHPRTIGNSTTEGIQCTSDRYPERSRLSEGSLVSLNGFAHALQLQLGSSLNQLKHCLARAIQKI